MFDNIDLQDFIKMTPQTLQNESLSEETGFVQELRSVMMEISLMVMDAPLTVSQFKQAGFVLEVTRIILIFEQNELLVSIKTAYQTQHSVLLIVAMD